MSEAAKSAIMALKNLPTMALQAVLSLPGKRFYQWASRSIDRALWHNPEFPTPHVATVDLGGLAVKFYAPTQRAHSRAVRTRTKEPITTEWLDRIGPRDVLWDVGANVGVYTIYGAMKRGCRVVAFEPAAANYWTLNRNIEINRLDDRVVAFCIAVARSTGFDRLHMPATFAGASGGNYGTAIDHRGDGFQAILRQGAIAYCIDDLVKTLLFPTYIKIDVDGIETDILAGGRNTLADARVRSVNVELNPDRKELFSQAVEIMRSVGFVLVDDAQPLGEGARNFIFDRAP